MSWHMKILEIKDLRTEFITQSGHVQAVRNIDFYLNKGETIGIVGESGSGKSVTMLSIMGLLSDNGVVKSGQIKFNGNAISPLDFNDKQQYEKMLKKVRCSEMSMIFQDPMTCLNPVLTIGKQIVEAIQTHLKLHKKDARKRAVELLKMVGIPSPEKRLKQYPFEFSGGMRQRIVIAIAISCYPKLIIADEPTTALDVTIQAQILDLIQELKQTTDASVIMITHDLGVVAKTCNRVLIMYGGKIVEQGTNREIFYSPKHPYTVGLLNNIGRTTSEIKQKLKPIPGSPPDLLAPPKGCPFVDRCQVALRICKDLPPLSVAYSETHKSACWHEVLRIKEATDELS